jgi:hypothetical protein
MTKLEILIRANHGQEHDRQRRMSIHQLGHNTNIQLVYFLINSNGVEGCHLPDGAGVTELQLSRHFLASVTALLVNVAVIVSPLRARVLVARGSVNAMSTL